MLYAAILVALVVLVAAGVLAWSRTRGGAPGPKGACPACGTSFVPNTDKACSKCGRSLVGVSPSARRLPSSTDDEDDDPLARTIVKSGRLEQLKTQCQSCGAALEGMTECPKCGARQG
jgi:hypothetical protein